MNAFELTADEIDQEWLEAFLETASTWSGRARIAESIGVDQRLVRRLYDRLSHEAQGCNNAPPQSLEDRLEAIRGYPQTVEKIREQGTPGGSLRDASGATDRRRSAPGDAQTGT